MMNVNRVKFLAHISSDGREQTIEEHLRGTAELAAKFCSQFGAKEYGYAAGIIHDIGKFDEKFQARLHGSNIRFEHSSAGAYELHKVNTPPAQMLAHCVAGHHSGLPDTGTKINNVDMPTLYGKIYRERQSNNDYGKYIELFDIDDVLPKNFPKIDTSCGSFFAASMLIRMIFSALVDADYLDTERFMSANSVKRLKSKSLDELYKKFECYMSRFSAPKTELHKIRNNVFNVCTKNAISEKGIYRMTIPTGGGKTLTSMGFALKHAIKNGMRRIIYVIPYTSIITQTVNVFREIFGFTNVIGHYSTAVFDDKNEEMSHVRLATENWDAPIIVTTNVQFFESLYASKPSKCRKLHNIANSVIIFDEAQMLPTDYLLPCLTAIAEMCVNYKCTAVLCTATQPSVDNLLPAKITVKDIYPDYESLYTKLKRCVYKDEGKLNNDEISKRLAAHSQALCIVNAKKTAREIYEEIKGEGVYHLSTYMYPAHIIKVLTKVKKILKEQPNKNCKLISTSLIEAGVDISFPVVYREYAGIDSIIQAGGRCNRENDSEAKDSVVHMFESENMWKRLMPSVKQTIEIAMDVIKRFDDISSPVAIEAYFNNLFKIKGKDELDKKKIIKEYFSGFSFGFKTASEKFKLIENDTTTVFIPREKKALEIYNKIKKGFISSALLREAGLYSVDLYEKEFEALYSAGCIDYPETLPDFAVLSDLKYYSDDTGIQIPKQGEAIIV